MTEPGVLLIHGLGGTQYDLGSLQKRLKHAGFAVYSPTLPGHGTRPEDLVQVRVGDWLDAVRQKYHEVIGRHEVLHVVGMCMGALLAVELVKRERHARGRLVALAPPVFIDGWATPWYREVRRLLYHVPGAAERMKIVEEAPYGLKNEQLRAIIQAKFKRGDNFHYRWVPLACIREVDRLRAMVMRGLDSIVCPTLVVHAREDELTSLRSAHYLVEHIGGRGHAGRARMVVLEDSYHMVCVDNDREIVARNVLEFLGVTAESSLGIAASEPGMSAADLQALLTAVLADLARGDFASLFARGTPEVVWSQPGTNRTSGVFRGSQGLARMQAWAGEIRFDAFGAPSINRGMAVVPATLRASADFASQGIVAVAVHAGRLRELRWFPDAVQSEDTYFGATTPAQMKTPVV
ncbi:alpha/beta hydrolase [Pandoraea oxalativorans]|uniref:Esterase n=1 Tax=Pandoraea oxalativorans TaxID=573737 RepID=A0A192B0W7_9BURK|nr:alpha/beta fold hydrolase [Pandoraea oxalativorans]ANJ86763.1 esterase [Pandoraea oxalativorans]